MELAVALRLMFQFPLASMSQCATETLVAMVTTVASETTVAVMAHAIHALMRHAASVMTVAQATNAQADQKSAMELDALRSVLMSMSMSMLT